MKLSVILSAGDTRPALIEAHRRIEAFFKAKGCEGEIIVTEEPGKAMLAARGEFVLVTEAMLRTPIKEVDKLLAALESDAYDAAVGSRPLSLAGFIRVACAFKCYKRSAVQALADTRKSGSLRIKKVPVMWKSK